MLKKILQLVVILLFITQGVMAQSVEIADVTLAPGNIQVPVEMLDFTGANGDVGAITLHINYDSDLLDFTNISNMNPDIGGQWLAKYNGDTDKVIITWTTSSGSGYDIDGLLLDLEFYYKGGFETDVAFVEAFCEVANNTLGNIVTTYVAGSVSQLGSDGTISMGDPLQDVIGNTVSMPLNIEGTGFGTVSALTFMVAFDETELSFVGIDEDAISGVTAYANGGILEITWTGLTPEDFTDPTPTHLLDMKFVYLWGEADVEFMPGCEITDVLLGLLPFDHSNGSVSQTPAVGDISMDDLTQPIGNTIIMPLNIEGGGFGSVSALSFFVAFDDTKLTFVGIDEDEISGVTASAGGGMLEITWTGLTPEDFTDPTPTHLFDMKFVYNGGEADVEFSSGCEITDDVLGSLPFNHSNGTVLPDGATPSLTLSAIGGTVGEHVLAPIVASDFTATLGAITLNVSYDYTKLTYTGFTVQQLSGGWLANDDGNGNLILLWEDNGGSLLADGNMITLDFIYDAGGQADLSFAPGSIVESVNLVNIPVNFAGGSVANYEVSGKLTYNNIAARPIYTTTVYLRNPSDSTIVYTTTTDVNGDFTFTGVGVGSFFLDGATTLPWGGVSIVDALMIKANPGSFVAGTLPYLAADVTTTNGVNIVDALIIKAWVGSGTKPAGWQAADWLFENKPVNVVSADVVENFAAICSGDAQGNYTGF